MNKLKRVAAVLCSLAISLSLAAMPGIVYASDMTVYTETSTEKANLTETVTWYVQGNSYTNAGMVHFFDWQGYLVTGGWEFGENLAGDSSKNIEIKFDFNAVSLNKYISAALGYSGEVLNGWNSTPLAYNMGYRIFKIKDFTGDNYTLEANDYFNDVTLTKNTWYTVTTQLALGSGIERHVITDKATGNVIKDTDWQPLRTGAGAWETDKIYDKIRFTVNNGPNGHLQVDNISVKETKLALTPKVTKVTLLDFGGNEKDSFDVSTSGFKVTFSTDMDEASLNEPGVVTLTDDAGNELSLTKTLGKSNELIITIDELLKTNTKYTLKISEDAISSEEVALDKSYEASFDTTAEMLIFEADFDNTNPDPVSFNSDGKKGRANIIEDENGNKFVHLSSKYYVNNHDWMNYGYKFSKPLGSQTYKITFDFVPYALSGSYDNFTLASGEKVTGGWNTEFELVKWTNNAVTVENTTSFSGINQWSTEKWYSYEMILDNSSKTYTVTITDKEDPEAVAAGKGTVPENNGFYGFNMRSGAEIYLDNIIVETIKAEPKAPDVSFVKMNGETVTDIKNVTPSVNEVLLNFGEIMNLRSFDGNISFTKESTGEDVYYNLTSDGTKVCLKDLSLEPGESYALNVSDNVVSIYGDKVKSGLDISFKVKDSQVSMSLAPLDVKLKDFTDTDITINATNTTKEDVLAKLLISYFDENGKIVEFSGYNTKIPSLTEGTVTVPVTVNPEAKGKAKGIEIMLWESLAEAKPMSDYIEIK